MLLEILNKLYSATSIKPVPFGTNSTKDNCIVYNCYTTSDNGAVCQKRLELRLITHSLEKAEELRKKIISALVTQGDIKEIEDINSCVVSGGGQLKDAETDTIHTMLYFDIIIRSEK